MHLRKQTEDKARQLELAYNYAATGNVYMRQTPPKTGPAPPKGGVELPYPPTSTASTVRSPRNAEDKVSGQTPTSYNFFHDKGSVQTQERLEAKKLPCYMNFYFL